MAISYCVEESNFANYETIPSVSACPDVTIKSLGESVITGRGAKNFAEEFSFCLWLRNQDIDFDFKD